MRAWGAEVTDQVIVTNPPPEWQDLSLCDGVITATSPQGVTVKLLEPGGDVRIEVPWADIEVQDEPSMEG